MPTKSASHAKQSEGDALSSHNVCFPCQAFLGKTGMAHAVLKAASSACKQHSAVESFVSMLVVPIGSDGWLRLLTAAAVAILRASEALKPSQRGFPLECRIRPPFTVHVISQHSL